MNGFSSPVTTAVALCMVLWVGPTTSSAGQPTKSETSSSTATGDQATSERPLLLELFTSQGCHSCPPADQLLRELSQYEQLIPLSFHVDYWNHLGWQDPFSRAEWSERQRQYARILRSDTVYTPQLVIDGQVDEVGSDKMEVLNKIAERLEVPLSSELRTVTVEARLLAQSPSGTEGQSRIELKASANPSPTRGQVLLVALYERHLTTSIPRGENRNKTLHYDFVVRRLEKLRSDQQTTIDVDAGWQRENLGVVAFVQDAGTGEVLALARVRAPIPAH